MKGMNDFLKKLTEETDSADQEDASKNLAKEDALKFVADFVKSVKGKFSKNADRIEIIRAGVKTLQFYVDELEGDSFATSLSIDLSDDSEDYPEDNFGIEDEVEEED
jgi:hypothetical protein